MIRAQDLCLTYPGVVAGKKLLLNSISFEILPGKITLFIGKSGAGKTTILKCISQLLPQYTGDISWNGRDLKSFSLTERSGVLGFVFQHFNLFPHLTVLDNCIDPLIIRGVSRADAERVSRQKLALLGMEEFVDRLPKNLSGGQQQRVAIARVLALQPQVLLLDEPTSALDPENTKILLETLKALSLQGIAIAISSQDMNFVRLLMDRIYFLEHGSIVEMYDKTRDAALPDKIAQFLHIS